MLKSLVNEFSAVLWKELLDLSRDYKTIAAVILLPLVSLPSIALLAGLLTASQTATIAIVVEDDKASQIAGNIAGLVERKAAELGIRVNVTLTYKARLPPADVEVVIPRGFYENMSRLEGQTVVSISRLVGSPASDLAYRAVIAALSDLSSDIVNWRIGELARMANTTINPDLLRNPILVSTGYHLAGGAPAGEAQAETAVTARILQFSLFFVAYPAVVFMSDAIVGERERRTIEKLLAAPISRGGILAGKMVAASLLGLIAAVADSFGLLAFFYLALGSLRLSIGVAAAWALAVFAIIAVTVALSTIIASRSESVRSAQIMSSIVVMIAMAIYFSALLVDMTKIPARASTLLQLIPFTHSALVVHWASLGDLQGVARHILILLLFFAILAYISVKEFRSERLILLR